MHTHTHAQLFMRLRLTNTGKLFIVQLHTRITAFPGKYICINGL